MILKFGSNFYTRLYNHWEPKYAHQTRSRPYKAKISYDTYNKFLLYNVIYICTKIYPNFLWITAENWGYLCIGCVKRNWKINLIDSLIKFWLISPLICKYLLSVTGFPMRDPIVSFSRKWRIKSLVVLGFPLTSILKWSFGQTMTSHGLILFLSISLIECPGASRIVNQFMSDRHIYYLHTFIKKTHWILVQNVLILREEIKIYMYILK